VKPALLVIDVQKEFFGFDPETSRSLHDAIGCINQVIAFFRKLKLPVVCIQHIEEEMELVPGKEGFDLPEELHILPTDLHIEKRHGNAFNETPLEAELRQLGVDTVILTGFCAEYCVLATYYGAKDIDLTPILLRGTLASGRRSRIRFVEEICDLISPRALVKTLE